jgi:hypothetical protein
VNKVRKDGEKCRITRAKYVRRQKKWGAGAREKY